MKSNKTVKESSKPKTKVKKVKKKSKVKKRIFLTFSILAVFSFVYIFSVNAYVKNSTKNKIVSAETAAEFDADCIVVLGAKVFTTRPSTMLADRLTVGIELYNLGAAPKILMSGDHGREEYDEVNIMKNYAIDHEVPSEDIFMDHAGFSTYESIYRAKKVFEAKKIIIVSQGYHLYRALYIAEELGLEAVAVASDLQEYPRQSNYDFREFAARNKDFLKTILKPKPTYLGDAIPVNGNGNVTNDK